MQMLAVLDKPQRWLATRGGLSIYALNKILNRRRHPSELQVLRICAGFVCTDDELINFRRLDEVHNALATLKCVIDSSRLGIEQIATESLVGPNSLSGIVGGTIEPSEEELVRLFLTAIVRDPDRRKTVNDLLESAGDYVLGPRCDRCSSS